MSLGEWIGAIVAIISAIVGLTIALVKYFTKKQNRTDTLIATFGNIYKDSAEKHIQQNEKYLESSKEMIKVIEKNNNLIENNNLATGRLDETIREFKEVTKIITDDIAMRALLESRKRE